MAGAPDDPGVSDGVDENAQEIRLKKGRPKATASLVRVPRKVRLAPRETLEDLDHQKPGKKQCFTPREAYAVPHFLRDTSFQWISSPCLPSFGANGNG